MPLSERDIDLLSAYLDDALTESERAEFLQALAQSPELQRELADWQAMRRALAAMPTLRAPRDFTLTPAQVRPTRVLTAVWRVLSAAAAVVLLVGVAAVFVRQQQLEGEAIAQLATPLASPTATWTQESIARDRQATLVSEVAGGVPTATVSAPIAVLLPPTLEATAAVMLESTSIAIVPTPMAQREPSEEATAVVVLESTSMAVVPMVGIGAPSGVEAFTLKDDDAQAIAVAPTSTAQREPSEEATAVVVLESTSIAIVPVVGTGAPSGVEAFTLKDDDAQEGMPPLIEQRGFFAEADDTPAVAAFAPTAATQDAPRTLGDLLEVLWQLLLRALAAWLRG